MGRKIKGSKHHGVKNPEKQRQKKEDKIRMKINNRPSQEDYQEVPRRLTDMLKADVKTFKKQRVNKNKSKLLNSAKYMSKEQMLPGMTRPLKPIPVFQQKEGESKKSFYFRMHETIQSMKKQKEYESEFKVELQRDEHGNTKVVDAEPDELEEIVNSHKKKKLEKKGIVVKSKEEKRQERRLKEKMRKNKQKRGGAVKNPQEKDFDDFKDNASFGDIVHAPPSLKFKVRNPEEKMSKNKVNGLLLKQKLEGGGGIKVKKAKKENISLAKKVMLEEERKRVVEAYRTLKADKISF